MRKQLTPTQKRLLNSTDERGNINVRVTRIKQNGGATGEELNRYELDQLNRLEEFGLVEIKRINHWVSRLANTTILGRTYVARPAR